MKKIPKYVENMLQRREKLALQLMGVCSQVDEYCEKIGVDMNDPSASLLTHVTIYCEPWTAISCTRNAILKALENKK